MKRFSSLDINVIVRDLREKLTGLRIANIYDVERKTYLFKLQKPDHREFLLIESGVRVHTTSFQREHDDVPSVFALKLRKYLRTKRIESVNQMGIDRVIDFTIGAAPADYHLLVELYSTGNILLTDSSYSIITCIRNYKIEVQSVEYNIAPGQKYPTQLTRHLTPLTLEGVQKLIDDVEAEQKGKETLKGLFNRTLDFGPTLIEHSLLVAGVSPDCKVADYDAKNTEAIFNAFKSVEGMYNVPGIQKGYVILKPNKNAKKQPETTPPAEGQSPLDGKLFMAFSPALYKQYESGDYLEFPSFDTAVDTFFSKIESQNIDVKRDSNEGTVSKKIDQARKNHEKRIQALKQEELTTERKAQLIEFNVDDVEAAIMNARSELANGIDWSELWQIIKEAKRNGDPTANIIHSLKLENNEIVLLLADNTDEDVSNPPMKVEVDINQSAYGNAERYYLMKKRTEMKHQKTVEMAENALKAAERKARAKVKEVKVKDAIKLIRKTYWFEKFYWFITSENYLVLSGRDAQQNEILVKRYMRKGDIYVHADIHGASSCIVRNNDPSKPVPELTLAQAGHMTVCRSSAWNAKVVTSAWWVYDHQVSKTAPSGEYLVTGSFMIRGKKNFLPAAHMVMGFGFLFKLDDSCLAAHINERRVRGEGDEDEGENDDPDARESEGVVKKPRDAIVPLDYKGKEHADDDDGNDDNTDDTETNDNTEESNSKEEESDKQQQPTTPAETPVVAPSKYRVAILQETPLEDGAAPLPTKPPTGDQANTAGEGDGKQRKRMNAAERKRAKKGKKRGEAGLPPAGPQPAGQPKPKPQQQQQQEVKKAPPAKVPRGKKAKLKKIKTKYADQDEEERRIRMELLASAGNKKKQEEKEMEEKKRKDKEFKDQIEKQKKEKYIKENEKLEANRKQRTEVVQTTVVGENGEEYHITSTAGAKGLFMAAPKEGDKKNTTATTTTEKEGGEAAVVKEDDEDDDEEQDAESGAVGEDSSQEEKRRLRKERRQAKKEEDEEIKKLLEEEGIVEDGDAKRAFEWDSLTGIPKENDVLQFAVPVCAPYSAIKNYKYKVKLLPGKGKKGNAAQTVLTYFLRLNECTPREKELLKSTNEGDLMLQMLSNVRVMTPGFTQKKVVKNKKKKANKPKAPPNEEDD